MDYNLFYQIKDFEELEIFLISIEEYINSLLDLNLKDKIKDEGEDILNIDMTLKGIIENIYGDVFKNSVSMNKIKDSLLYIKNNAKIITIFLSKEIDEGFKFKLKEYFQKNIDKDVLLKYRIKDSIGGGIILETSSKYLDYSFDSVLNANTDKIISIINNDKI